jgi:3-isopropylmalate/(R)-2-methylmalate dehydratase large subunit
MTLCQQINSSHIFSSLVPCDATVKKYLSAPYGKSSDFVVADAQAEYSAKLDLELSWLEPQIGIVGAEVEIRPLAKVKKHKISWAILGASTDSNLEDLEIAAKILKGRKIPKEVKMAVIPGSKTVYLNALKKNLVRTFLQAGCIFMYPGSNSFNFFEDDKVISTFNWNLSKQQVYLASPATVAASAVKGKIADPREFL